MKHKLTGHMHVEDGKLMLTRLSSKSEDFPEIWNDLEMPKQASLLLSNDIIEILE